MFGLTIGTTLLLCWWGLRRTAPPTSSVASVFFGAFFVYSIAYYVAPGAKQLELGAFLAVALYAALGERRRTAADEHSRNRPAAVWSLAAAVGLVAWLGLRNISAIGIGPFTLFVPIAAAVAILLFGWSLGRGLITAQDLARQGAAYLGLVMVVAALQGGDWVTCTDSVTSKCTAAGRIYVGIYGSSNVLTLFAAVTLLLAVHLPASRWRTVFVAALVAVMVITGSRTTFIAVAALPVLGLAAAMTARKTASGLWVARRWVIALIYAGTVTAGFRLLYAHPDPNDFSRRGQIWLDIKQFVTPSSTVGLGRARYDALEKEGHFFGHFPHSQYLLLLFFGGMVAIVLYGLLLTVAAASARATTRFKLVVAIAPVLLVIVHGLTELSWDASSVDPYLYILFVVLTSATTGAPHVDDPGTGALAPGLDAGEPASSLWERRERSVASDGWFDGRRVHLEWPG